jgi:hypothetical protein
MQKSGKFLGIPYDFRFPTLSRIRERMWNREDPRIFTPRVYGAGWTVNFATLKDRSTPGFVLAVAIFALMYLKLLRNMKKSLDKVLRRG